MTNDIVVNSEEGRVPPPGPMHPNAGINNRVLLVDLIAAGTRARINKHIC